MKSHIISVRINTETYDLLDKKSRKEKKPISTIINRLIEDILSSEKKK